MKKKKTDPNEEMIRSAKELKEKGYTNTEIGKELNVQTWRVRALLRG